MSWAYPSKTEPCGACLSLGEQANLPLKLLATSMKRRGIEDLSSQPTKHYYFQLLKPYGSWLQVDQASLHTSLKATIGLQTEAHISSLKNEPYKKPLKGKG